MTAKNTPLFENGSPTAIKIGESSINDQTMGVYMEPFDLPEHEVKRSVCEDHVISGTCSEMMDDFWIAGCNFDKSVEEGIIRVEFSCVGQSALRKKCRMKLTQYDAEGGVLSTGKLT